MKTTLKLLLILSLASCQEDKQTFQDIQIDPAPVGEFEPQPKPAPLELVYKDINGDEVKLSDHRGKWVVVNFWATWCAPCRKEMPDFVKFKNDYEGQVEILGIDFEDAEIDKIQSFIKDFNINYPILVTDVYNPTEFEKKNSLGLPTTVFFNPEGEQFDKRVGPVHYKDLVEITGLEPIAKEESEKIAE